MRSVLIYGLSMAALLVLLKYLELRLLIFSHAFEVYAVIIALVFMGLGIWLALKLAKPVVKTVIIEKPVFHPEKENFIPNEEEIKNLSLSKRELEVLQLIAEGHSNNEIAEKLFVSLNTVKTHTSSIFEKLNVKRRTQAIEKAKRLFIIP